MEKTTKNILIAFLLNFVFVVVELVGGIITGSVAILSDSIHDAGDCLAIGVAFLFEKKSNKKADKNYTYGYRRYSVVSALISSIILLGGAIVVIYTSILRIINPKPINGLGMFIIAVAGVLINGLAVIKTAKSKSINEKAINLHLLEDVLGWVVVLIGSIFVWAFNFTLLDPILSILVTAYVIIHAISHIKEAFSIILERSPNGFDDEKFMHKLCDIEGVKEIHHLHIWTLDGESLLATVHVVIENENQNMGEIKSMVKHIAHEFDISHITIQIDLANETCEDCECLTQNNDENHQHSHTHCHSHHH